MTNHDRSYRRILRRETHSSRSGMAITLAVVVILGLGYLAAESVLAFLNQPPLLRAPTQSLTAIADLPASVPASTLAGAGVLAAVLGLALIVVALSPGRLPAHVGQTTRTALVVDNRAIASVLARRAAYAADLEPDHVVVSVSRRRADVRVQPVSGWPVNRDVITDAVSDEIARLNVAPVLRPRVSVADQGVVGA